VLAGNVYETPTHPGRAGKGDAWIHQVAATGATVIAIGGVLPEHVPILKRHGCHGVATLRAWLDPDPAAAAARYL
jgi:thiamine monophosphate synthase